MTDDVVRSGIFQQALVAGRETLEHEARTILLQIEATAQSFPQVVDLVAGLRGRFVISGLGKSGHIGRKIAATLASTGTPSFFIHSTEALHGDAGMVGPEDAVMLISSSGETAEVCRFAEVLRFRGIPIVGVTRRADSTLAKGSTVTLVLDVEREADPLDLAPTASTTATLAIGDALAAALMTLRGFTAEDFALHHVGGSLGEALDADRIGEPSAGTIGQPSEGTNWEPS